MEQVIFLPGASGHVEFWQPMIEHLPDSFKLKVIAYPEFGGAPAQDHVKNFNDLQNFVIDSIVEFSEDQQVIVVAQSMGGIFAVQSALQYPNQIKALVLIATSGGIDLSPFDVADWRQDYQLQYSVPDWFVKYKGNLDHDLNQINIPVLLIWGDQDLISPTAVGEYLQSKFKNAELYVVSGGEHDLAMRYSRQVASKMLEFINQLR